MARSPNYPKLNLEEAIERVKTVYQAEHLHLAAKDAVAQDLGYKGVNGSSARLITALKHYGLVEEHDKDRIRVTDDAMTILELPRDDPNRMQALQNAVFAPQVFADLRETYEGQPPSDVNIRHHLLRKKFLPGAADEVIRIYRDNLQLVAEQAPEYTAEIVEDDRTEVESPVQPTQKLRADRGVGAVVGGAAVQPDAVISPETVLQFQLPGNSTARIELIGDVTQEAIDMLTAILNAQKLVFPKAHQVERTVPSTEQPALEPPEPE